MTLYTDDTRQYPVLGFKARQVIDLGATYDVTDAAGQPIGTFRKDFARSLLRSTWIAEQPGLPAATGEERSMLVAALRPRRRRRTRPGAPGACRRGACPYFSRSARS